MGAATCPRATSSGGRPAAAPYAASLVHYEGLLYFTNDVGVLTCADAKTGERVWQTRLDGVFFASPVAADGKIYFASQTGETIVVKAGRVPTILARNDLGERLVASPAISNGQILLRERRATVCDRQASAPGFDQIEGRATASCRTE